MTAHEGIVLRPRNRKSALLCLLLLTAPTLLAAATAAAAPPPGGPPSAWSPATLLGGAHVRGDQVVTAASDDGTALAAWTSTDTASHVMVSLYTAPAGWSQPYSLLDNPAVASDSNWASDPSVFASTGGHYVLAGLEYPNDTTYLQSVVVRTRGPYGAWSGPEWPSRVQTTASPQSPHAVEDVDGDLNVVWVANNGSGDQLWSALKPQGGTWSAPAALSGPNVTVVSAAMAGDPYGDAVVVYRVLDQGPQYDVWANTYDALSGWSAPTPIEFVAGDVPLGFTLDVAMAQDGSGVATAVWNTLNGSTDPAVATNRFVPGAGWQGLSFISDTAYPDLDSVCAGSDGTVAALWHDYFGPASGDMSVRVQSPEGVWGGSHDLAGDGFRGFLGSCAVTPAGRVAVVGSGGGSGNVTVQSAHQLENGSWAVDGPVAGSSWSLNGVRLAAPSTGGLAVVWTVYDGIDTTLWGAGAAPPDTEAPALALEAPADGSAVTAPTVRVEGTTEPGARLDVAGVAGAVAADGSFSVPVALVAGDNALTVTARDAAGNPATVTVHVEFDDPSAALEEDLGATQQDLTDTQAALDAATARLESSEANVSSLELELAATRARADDAQANATALAARVADLEAAPAGGQDMVPLLVALAALAVGAVAVVLSLRGRGGGAAPPPAPGAGERADEPEPAGEPGRQP